jgi:hypothetical protein
MKEITLPSRLNTFVANVLDTLASPEKSMPKRAADKVSPNGKHARSARKDYFHYTPLIDHDTQQVVGHLSDISAGGFRLDSSNPLPVNKDFRFTLNLTGDLADKPFMVFTARSKWCKIDPLDPFVYNVGYQLVHISQGDREIFNRMMERYAREFQKTTPRNMRRSNQW